MKTTLFFILTMLLLQSTIFGQNDLKRTINENDLFSEKFLTTKNSFDQKKNSAFYNYLYKVIEYPAQSINCGLQGTEIIRFEITSSGELINLEIVNSVCPAIDSEIIRTLEATNGFWVPAFSGGKAVNTVNEISLIFKLHETNDFQAMAKNLSDKANKFLFVKKTPKRALKYYNEAIKLLPKEESLLQSRGLCLYQLGNFEKARKDWNRVKELGDAVDSNISSPLLSEAACNMTGFAEMNSILLH